jgi:hypothetical protein
VPPLVGGQRRPEEERVWHPHGNDRLALVAGAADNLEPDQRRRPLAVVVANVEGEPSARGRPAGALSAEAGPPFVAGRLYIGIYKVGWTAPKAKAGLNFRTLCPQVPATREVAVVRREEDGTPVDKLPRSHEPQPWDHPRRRPPACCFQPCSPSCWASRWTRWAGGTWT